MKLSVLAAAAWLAMAISPVAQAQALPVTGGITSVTLTSAPFLAGAGLGVAPLGSALVSPGSTGIPLAYFPVTGGAIDTVTFAGGIAHEGSGLRLSSTGASADLTDFFIDTVSGVLSGNVSFGSTALAGVPLFSLSPSGVIFSPFSLAVTPTAAGALTAIFGVPDLTGYVIGTANTVPITSAVPEPATVASMLAGLALIGALSARRRAVAARA